MAIIILRILIINFVIFFSSLHYLQAEEFRTTYNIKILPCEIKKEYISLWQTVKGHVVYGFNQINYYKIVDDDDISDIKIKFKIYNFKSDFDFTLECEVNYNKKFFLKYLIQSKKDIENFPSRFFSDIKIILPLRGVIFKKKDLYLNVNIGKYYNVKKGDVFFIVKGNNIKGIAQVLQSHNHYSKCLITSENQKINKNDVLIPFYYELNKQYNLYYKPCFHDKLKVPYELKGLYGHTFCLSASLGNYIFISDEKETGIFANDKKVYEKIEDLNFNKILKVKFNLFEKYSGYILSEKRILKLIHLNNFSRYILKYNNKKSLYKFILEQEKNIHNYHNVLLDDFSFYREDDMIFFDKACGDVISINIKNSQFEKINLTNKITAVEKILVSPNNKKLIIFATDNKVVIKDLEDSTEEVLKNIDDVLLSKTGVYLICKGENLIFHDLYTQKHKQFKIKEPFDKFILSYSERYFIFTTSDNPNSLNYLDVQNNKIIRDSFQKARVKYIKKIESFNNDSLLLYGKLFDMDYNNKLDYLDLNNIISFNFITGKYTVLLKNVNDYYNFSNYKRYIFYSQKNKLFIKDIYNEKTAK